MPAPDQDTSTRPAELPTLKGHSVLLREPLSAEVEYVARAIADDPEASPWWGTDAAKILRWLRDPEARVFVIEVAGEVAGIIMYEEESDPDYKSAGIDITLLEPWVGRRLGRDALITLAAHLFDERGHHRIQIDPAAANLRAIRAYEGAGFKPVGILRRYERAPDGQWRDALLMDLLPEDLAAGAH